MLPESWISSARSTLQSLPQLSPKSTDTDINPRLCVVWLWMPSIHVSSVDAQLRLGGEARQGEASMRTYMRSVPRFFTFLIALCRLCAFDQIIALHLPVRHQFVFWVRVEDRYKRKTFVSEPHHSYTGVPHCIHCVYLKRAFRSRWSTGCWIISVESHYKVSHKNVTCVHLI